MCKLYQSSFISKYTYTDIKRLNFKLEITRQISLLEKQDTGMKLLKGQ